MVVAVDATGMPVVAKGVVVGRQERLSALADFVVERGSVSVEDVMDALGVSPATVRRDLDALAEQQLIIRTRGGASANPSTGEVPLRYRTARRPDEKAAIARRASALVSPGEVVGFNGGTTTTAAAHELGVRMAREPGFDDQPVTIVTNAVNIANDLTIRPQARVVCTGGVARTRSYELVGPLAGAILPSISIDTLFLGVQALDPEAGVFNHTEDEAAINALLAKASRRVIVLADSTKLGTSAFARICGIRDLDALITDAGADQAMLDRLRAQGVEILLA